MAKAKNKNELRLLRVFNAPAKLVWEAWTEDQHVSHWWGPRGFTLTTQSKNLKTGGQWIYTMHGPDGTDYPNITTYFEVEPYKRLVYNHGATADREALFKVTVEFKEVHNKTHMDMTMTLATEEAAQEIKKFIKQAGGDSTWDRLSEYVEERKKNQDVFIINRSFETDQKTLFKMWTTPEHITPTRAERGPFPKVSYI
ncbi:MAG: SRPBCC domain-containing protein [Pseudobdellovibrio sp.]